MATLRIHQDRNNGQENSKHAVPVPAKENAVSTTALQPQKRAVLGLISKNHALSRAQTKIQHKEDPKSKFQDRGFEQKQRVPTLPVVPLKASFAIHVDNVDVNKKDGKTKADVKASSKPTALPSGITGLHRPALQELVTPVEDELNIACEALNMSTSSAGTIDLTEDQPQQPKPTLAHLIECEEYKSDIYQYLLTAETRHRPKPFYMKKQPDITYSMRAILVDWLVEVAEEYNLQTETLYLAVSYIDRFLSLMSVVRNKLQLVGTAAMFIAAKYEEIYPPDVGEFVYITDDTYTKKQVLRMEHLILKVLGFDMSTPTTLSFIVNYCTSTKASDSVLYLAMYVSELSLLEGDPFLNCVPSVRAAAAVALARHTLHLTPAWTPELEETTSYQLSDLLFCAKELHKLLVAAPTHAQQAIREKYRSSSRRDSSSVEPRSCEDLLF